METSSTTYTVLSQDPVSSLRAVALSTLKAKRRKALVEKSVSLPVVRPPPPDAIQLDYGQEDNSLDAAIAHPTSNTPSTPPNPPSLPKDTQMREEGEISDEEESPITAEHPKSPTPPQSMPGNTYRLAPEPVVLKTEDLSEQHTFLYPLSSVPIPPEPMPMHKSTTALVDRISDRVPHSFVEEPGQEAKNEPMEAETEFKLQPPLLLAPDRVRPGVPLTQDEYDTVKDIVLDLLGWGVSPDDIVTCGIAKETAYYVFNELNLRLPEQFDTSGLVPYTPESFPHSPWSQISPPFLPGKRRDSIASSAASYCSSHHSPRLSTPSPRPNVILPTTSPLTIDPHDMERQKRQELMARKAVQASRKNKQLKSRISLPDSPSRSLSCERTTNPGRPPVAPTDTVEEFLNSIGTGESSSEILVPVDFRRISVDDAMDVDFYGTDARTIETDKGTYTDDLVISPTAQDPPFVPAPPPLTEGQPLSVDSPIPTFSQASQLLPLTPLESSGEPVPEPQFIMRRGVKRPVAADFVDFDPVPKRLETTNGSFNGLISRPTSSANFRDVGLRRCVIDLSDSEGESEEQPSMVEDVSWNWRDKRAKSSKYPSPAPAKPLSGTMSPAALAQKELEIRKMRGLIAQREEETRLRKLALSRSLNKDDINNTTTSTPGNQSAHTLNRGDVDQVALASDDAGGATAPSGPGPSEAPKASGLSSVHSVSPSTLDDALNGFPVTAHPSLNPELTELDPPPKAQDVLVDPHQVQSQETSQVIQMPAEELVDAGWDPSPSTEAPLTTVLQRQDTKESPLLENSPTNNEDVEDFLVYRSPFESYPSLHVGPRSEHSGQNLSSFSLSSHMYPSNGTLLSFPSSQAAKLLPPPSFISSSAYLSSRLRPLKLATTSKLLDPTRRLCQYEVPGGGTCRDERCEDVHLSRLDGVNQLGVVEPSDEDSAEYLFNSLPRSWLTDNDISTPSKILNALQQVRYITLNEPLGFESRVAQALRALECPAPT